MSKKILENGLVIIEWEIFFHLSPQKWRRVNGCADDHRRGATKEALRHSSTIQYNNKATREFKGKGTSFQFWIVWLWTVKWTTETLLYWCSKTCRREVQNNFSRIQYNSNSTDYWGHRHKYFDLVVDAECQYVNQNL